MTTGRLFAVVAAVPDRLRCADPLPLLLRASLLTLLINTNEDPLLFVLVAATCIAVLPRESLIVNPWLWATMFVVVAIRQLSGWHTVDDHVVVTTYWCGAIALSLGAEDPARTLASAARWLIAGVFIFAAGWKLLSGQFLDGTFFRYTFLFDDRFSVVARAVGGTSRAALEANLADVRDLLAGRVDGSIRLREGPRNVELALVFTWWGAVIESAVALTFAAPLHEAHGWIRHVALIAFAATTYAVVPIGGFGVLLVVLGATMCGTARSRAAYLLGAACLLVWTIVWPVLFL